jgi:hypothetical protein
MLEHRLTPEHKVQLKHLLLSSVSHPPFPYKKPQQSSFLKQVDPALQQPQSCEQLKQVSL